MSLLAFTVVIQESSVKICATKVRLERVKSEKFLGEGFLNGKVAKDSAVK
jgi:hypothetical protein